MYDPPLLIETYTDACDDPYDTASPPPSWLTEASPTELENRLHEHDIDVLYDTFVAMNRDCFGTFEPVIDWTDDTSMKRMYATVKETIRHNP